MGLISRVSSRTYREVSAKHHSTNMFTSKMKKATDWTRLGWCMQEKIAVGSTSTSMFANGKTRFVQFKAASDAVLGKHSTASARPKSIDFSAYKAALPGQADWVSSMEAQYNETVIPRPADVLSEVVAADDEAFEQIAESSRAALDSAATDAQAEFDKLNSLPPSIQMAKHHADPSNMSPEEMDKTIEDARAARQSNKK